MAPAAVPFGVSPLRVADVDRQVDFYVRDWSSTTTRGTADARGGPRGRGG